jgi:glucose/arabinose dehydrogenase
VRIRLLVCLVSSGALALLPMEPLSPISGGMTAEQVVSCRIAEPQCWPVAFDFAPDGSEIFYVERRTGQIRRYSPATQQDDHWHTIPDVHQEAGGQGLLGIELAPSWPASPWVYAFFTHGGPLQDRLVRLREAPPSGVETETLLTLKAGDYHNGADLEFGAGGRLYLVTGDADEPQRAQQIMGRNGKVLRMTKSGGIPASNPFPGSYTYSYGHRNSFGLAFDPIGGDLWETENGPECKDELNRIRRGRNFGWGVGSSCPNTSSAGPNPVPPERTWSPPISPTGAAFCVACGLGPEVHRDLLMGSFNDRRIRRFDLSADRERVIGAAVLYVHPLPVLGVEAGPDGAIYFSDAQGIYRLEIA